MLAHEQIRLLSVKSVHPKIPPFKENPPRSERNSLLKEMRDETLIGLLHVKPHKKYPLLIKRIGTTRLDQPADRFPALSASVQCALDHALRSLKWGLGKYIAISK